MLHMTFPRWLRAFVVPVATLAFMSPAFAADPIRPERLEELHKLIKPSGRELTWTKIPWMTSLWEARQRAAREGKPILLWEMDGHPMGCV